jgi:hypothetical protein
MTENQHERSPIDRPELQKLFVKWLIQLLDERHGVKQRGSSGAEGWNIILADDSPVEAEFDSSGQPRVKGPPEYEQELASVVEDASRRTLALDFGSGAWWRASFYTDMGLSGVTMLHFLRLMSEHNPRRFSGGWRLGSEALVYFEQGNTEPTPVSIPKFDIQIPFQDYTQQSNLQTLR